MSDTFMDALVQACEVQLAEMTSRYEKIHGAPGALQVLDEADIEMLSEKIRLLPDEDTSILFFRYVFGCNADVSADILGIPNAKGRLYYLQEVLARAMALPPGTGIAGDSMAQACKRALSAYVADSLDGLEERQPRYSQSFRKALKPIRGIPRQENLVVYYGKRAAAVALVSGIGIFSLNLAANAQFREAVFRWTVEQLETYGLFSSPHATMPMTEENYQLLKECVPTYIPANFTQWSEPVYMFPGIYYQYIDQQDYLLTIHAQIPSSTSVLLDTEDAVIENITLQGWPAMTWEHNGIRYLVWQREGFEFIISGPLDQEEILKIAVGIKEHG